MKIFPCLCLVLVAVATASADFEVGYYPQACYFGKPFTFVLKGTPGSEVKVSLNDSEVHRAAFKGNRLEINLPISESGILEFRQNAVSHSFFIIQPGDNVVLSEKDGYLYREDTPAILLAKHNEPPPFNRKWLPIRYVISLFNDTRPVIRSGLLFHNAGFSHLESDVVAKGLGSIWSVSECGEAMYEINSLVMRSIHNSESADAAAIALATRDHELGIEPLCYRIKLEWCIQALLSNGFRHVFVASPALTQIQRTRFGGLKHHLLTACRAHKAALIDMTFLKRPFKSEIWLKKFLAGIKRVVRCE